MSVWSKIGEIASSITLDAFSTVVEAVRSVFEGDPETRRQVTFSIAIIALSAKMAKADGIVTNDEINAFRDIFAVPNKEAAHVARLYNLAKQDVSGFVTYAQQVRKLFPGDSAILEDVMDGLYHIAKADGFVHVKEQAFLDTIADVFAIPERNYERIKMRHVDSGDTDPYELLDADPGWDDRALKAHYRQLVRQNHPDRLTARGVPEEFVMIANGRLAAINRAWDTVKRERGM
jgi:DnaJ like chaperone protein